MSVLRPLDKLPVLNTATILVGVRSPAPHPSSPACQRLSVAAYALSEMPRELFRTGVVGGRTTF